MHRIFGARGDLWRGFINGVAGELLQNKSLIPPPRRARDRLRLEKLEDRTVPSAAGRLWLLQLEGLASSGALQSAQQISAVQQRLGQAGVSATVVRHLGLDGLTLVQLPTEQAYSAVNQAMSRVAGFRFVRSNMLGETPLFSADASSGLSPVPGQWVLHIDGIIGSRAEQLRWAKLYVGGTDSGLEVLEQVGRDGVFMARSSLDRTFESIDQSLRVIPGYRRLEANTVGWVIHYLAVDPSQNVQAAPGEWMLHVEGLTGTRAEQRDQIQQLLDGVGANATVVKLGLASGIVRIRTDPTRSYEDVERAIRAVEGYRMIQPNYIGQLSVVPNDQFFNLQYGLHNTGQTIQTVVGTPDADIDAPEAWDITTGSSSVIVAVIDSGIDRNHPDLTGNMWVNTGDGPAVNGVDNDNNSFTDDYFGWDFRNDDRDPSDDNGHGTGVAGVIGAKANNGIGVAGVNWNVQLMALKVANSGGQLFSSDAADAIEYVTIMKNKGFNIRVSNNSYEFSAFDPLMYNAVNGNAGVGVLFVAAAGNGVGDPPVGINFDVTPRYPASFNLPNVISVAATDNKDALASFSNYGAVSVDLAAPGKSIATTFPGNTYGFIDGTSFRALRSRHSSLAFGAQVIPSLPRDTR